MATLINAKSYDISVAKIQWPKMKKLVNKAIGFMGMGYVNKICSTFREYNLLLGVNFRRLQELYPNTDLFELKKKSNKTIKDFLNK